MTTPGIIDIRVALAEGRVVPYLGPELLALEAEAATVPDSPDVLVDQLTAKVTVPHKIRKNLTAAAQYIENFKHRKTLVTRLQTAFATPGVPNVWHRFLVGLTPPLPLIVNAWYDDVMAVAMAARQTDDWGQVQGVSRAEHFGEWTHYFNAAGERCAASAAEAWSTVLYQPLGSIRPEANFLVSDSDYVEVLTEIDIQTPIPERVQALRAGREFLFLGCRFRNQLERTFARQIMKRSAHRHWAVLAGPLTRNEQRFLSEQNIVRIDMALSDFVSQITAETHQPLRQATG